MFTRGFLPLLFLLIIVLPTVAQQANPVSTAPPTTSTDRNATASAGPTATGHEPLEQRHGNFWDGDEPGVAALLSHPFASKAYVQRQLRPIRDRLNELDELTAANSRAVKDVDANSSHGIQLASEKTNEADRHATDAAGKAQTAQEMAAQADKRAARIESAVSTIDSYKSSNQIEILFLPKQRELDAASKHALDELATSLKDQRGYVIELKGFSSGRGQAAILASRQMADSAARYLIIKHGIAAYRIYVQAMGGVSVATEKQGTGRQLRGGRVEVTVLKNDIDQLATSGSGNSLK